jgi:hypothetical protein
MSGGGDLHPLGCISWVIEREGQAWRRIGEGAGGARWEGKTGGQDGEVRQEGSMGKPERGRITREEGAGED